MDRGRFIPNLETGFSEHGALKFVTVCFFNALNLCNNSRNEEIFVLFRGLHLVELKIDNFSGVLFLLERRGESVVAEGERSLGLEPDQGLDLIL